MFTGLFPRHHELVMNGMALDPAVPTLATMLAGHGYRTHSVGKQHLQPLLAPAEKNMPDSRAFWQRPQSAGWVGPYYGFSTLDLLLGESNTAAMAGHYATWLKTNHPGVEQLLEVENAVGEPPPPDLDEIWSSAIPVELHYNAWIADCAVQFLEKASRETPFFLYVSWPDPHHPFSPPADYAGRYHPEDMPLPRMDAEELKRMPPYYGNLYPKGNGFRDLYWAGRTDLEAGSMITTEAVSDLSMRRAIAHTYAMIEMIDHSVGHVMKTLERYHHGQNTIILFTSDHGELLGTHGLLHKGPPPYRQLTQVSMLMQGPGIPIGKTVDALTNHIDLTPTFLELAGASYDIGQFDGTSLVPLLGEERDGNREYDFGEYHPTVKPELYNQTVRTERWRLTIYPEKREWGELFDLESDPEEHQNLFHLTPYRGISKELEDVLAKEFVPQTSVDNEWLCKW